MAIGTAPSVSMGRERRFFENPVLLWAAFVVVHLALGYLCLFAPGLPMGDVILVYKPWAMGVESGHIVGIDSGWVYPVVALIPVLLPLIGGLQHYEGSWLVLILLLDMIAFILLALGDRRRVAAAWWWLLFLLLLGPIALARLDSVSVPLAIVAVIWLSSRPRTAGVLLAVATWIKVWPVAIIGAVLIASKQRWRVLTGVVLTSAFVVIVALLMGGGANIFSFVGQQTGRGLQIESPISTFWMWTAALHQPGSYVYYDTGLLTFQVTGANINTVIALMNPLLVLAVLLVALIGLRAVLMRTPVLRILPALSLALVVTLIAFNKVGSPQYVAWLAVPVILGIVTQGRGFRGLAIVTALTAGLTQLVYPYFYDGLDAVNPTVLMVTVLSLRNLMFFVLLGWSLVVLWRGTPVGEQNEEDTAATVWPFAAKRVPAEFADTADTQK